MKTFSEQLASLTVAHRPKDATGNGMAATTAAALQQRGFFVATCLRDGHRVPLRTIASYDSGRILERPPRRYLFCDLKNGTHRSQRDYDDCNQ